MQKPSCILFDLGGTILEGTFDPLLGDQAVLAHSRNPFGISPDDIELVAKRLDATLLELKEASLLEVHIFAFQRLLYTLTQIEPYGTPEQIEQYFWNAAFNYLPTPDIAVVLENLLNSGIRMGIVSNIAFSGGIVINELIRHNLLGYFEHVICSSDYGFRKPSKILFDIALLKMKCRPEETWFIGDNYDIDVLGSVAAGMTGIWYNPSHKARPKGLPNLEVHSWMDLAHLFSDCCS
jgi:putative hydrolase of the HAD superfamily